MSVHNTLQPNQNVTQSFHLLNGFCTWKALGSQLLCKLRMTVLSGDLTVWNVTSLSGEKKLTLVSRKFITRSCSYCWWYKSKQCYSNFTWKQCTIYFEVFVQGIGQLLIVDTGLFMFLDWSSSLHTFPTTMKTTIFSSFKKLWGSEGNKIC
jgi:hypothetical protein